MGNPAKIAIVDVLRQLRDNAPAVYRRVIKSREKIEREQQRGRDADQRWIRELGVIFAHRNPKRYQEKPARDRKAHYIGKPKVQGYGGLEDPVHKQYSSEFLPFIRLTTAGRGRGPPLP